MIFKAFPNEAAGCIAYLLGCQKAGVAAVVDPGRADLDLYVDEARARGLALTPPCRARARPIRWPQRSALGYLSR